jgi:predicted DNA-binding ribbon-helix-helix protein
MAENPTVPGRIKKRTVRVGSKRTGITLENQFWQSLKQIAAVEKVDLHALLDLISKERETPNLSSAVRLFVLDYYRKAAIRSMRR